MRMHLKGPKLTNTVNSTLRKINTLPLFRGGVVHMCRIVCVMLDIVILCRIHKLLGHLLEETGNLDKAIVQFKRYIHVHV